MKLWHNELFFNNKIGVVEAMSLLGLAKIGTNEFSPSKADFFPRREISLD